MRYLRLLFLCSWIFSVSCNPEEIGNSKDVNPDTIYSSYNIQYKEGNQEVECTARYRFGGPEGTTLVLSDSSNVTLDDQLIAVDSSTYAGAFYKLKLPFAGFVGDHVWAFTDMHGKVYKETFNFKTIKLAQPIPTTIKASALDLKFHGLENGDSIYITIADTSRNKVADDKKYFVQNGIVRIPQTTIEALKPGKIEFDFYTEDITALKNSTKEGGQFTNTYTLKKSTSTLQK